MSELLVLNGSITRTVDSIIPLADKKKLGQNPHSYEMSEPLNLADWKPLSVEKGTQKSCLKTAGDFLDQVLVDNPHSMRVFSPDELVSNKLDAVFQHTGRNFQWDQYSTGKGGRVIEILSEHTCQGEIPCPLSSPLQLSNRASRLSARIHLDRTHRPLSYLRKLSRYRTHDDDSVQQIQQNVKGSYLEERHQQYQLH